MKKIKNIIKNNIYLNSVIMPIWKFYVVYIKRGGIFNILKVFPIKNNRIIVDNFNGRGYEDNPKAIIDELLNEDNKLDINWVLTKENKNEKLPQGVKKVYFGTYKYLYILATSKIWIDNVRPPFFIKKRKNQFYIQTWHSGIGLKKSEKAIEDKLPIEYVRNAKNDSKNANLFISNSNWESKLYRDDFWYKGEILEKGLPRNDILMNKGLHKKIRSDFIEKNNLDKNQKFILYAPTFRDDRNLDKYDIDFDVIINELQKITKQKWKVLLKLHPNVSDKSKKIFNNENIIDVSNGYELNSVMITSDLLITDYSSLMFDYSYLLKPIILYATDIDQMNKDRGFLFDLYELPFPISKTNIELLKIIKEFDYEIFEKNIKEFNKRLNINETGKASQYVAKIIKKEIDKKE